MRAKRGAAALGSRSRPTNAAPARKRESRASGPVGRSRAPV